MKVTDFYKFPLQWDQYPTDRLMIEEAFVRIDKTIHSIVFDGGGAASNVIYDGAEALPGENVSEALDRVLARTNQFEIAANATSQSDTNEVLWSMAVTRACMLPIDLDGSIGVVEAVTPVDLIIRIEHNGTPVGSAEIVQDAVSFVLTDDVTLFPGDSLTFVSEGEATFRSISLNLLAYRL